MTHLAVPASVLAVSACESLHPFVSAYKVHPILVNFTAALIPVSVGSDIKTSRASGTITWRLMRTPCLGAAWNTRPGLLFLPITSGFATLLWPGSWWNIWKD